MSYTYPASSSIDITFAGDAAYTYPAPDAVNISFYEIPAGVDVEAQARAPSVLGAVAVVSLAAAAGSISCASPLGVPAASAHVFTVARASAETLLGAVAAKAAVQASGLALASSPLTHAQVRAVMGVRAHASAPTMLSDAGAVAESPTILVPGLPITQYGEVSAVAIASPVAVAVTQYGSVFARYDVSVSVDAVEPSTRAGVPLAWHIESQAVTTVHDVYGSCSTVYGAPSAGHPQLGDVTGASLTAYGSLTSAVIAQPVAVSATAFGLPSAAAIASVPGVRGTKCGTPSNIVAHIVTGISRTKYGRPRVAFTDAHMVYGLNNGRRAGVPRAVEMV